MVENLKFLRESIIKVSFGVLLRTCLRGPTPSAVVSEWHHESHWRYFLSEYAKYIYGKMKEQATYCTRKKSDWIKIEWTTCLRNLGKKCHHTDRKRFLTCIYDLENTTSVAVFRHAYEQNTTRSANAENCELFLPHTGVDIFSLTGPASQSSWQ
jgi:hypothetical protein